MAEHENQPGPGHLAGKLQAAQDLPVGKVSGNARAKNVAYPLVEDQLGRDPRVNTAQDNGEGELAAAGLVHLMHQIPLHRPVGHEASIALLQSRQRLFRRHQPLAPRFRTFMFLSFSMAIIGNPYRTFNVRNRFSAAASSKRRNAARSPTTKGESTSSPSFSTSASTRSTTSAIVRRPST